MTIERLSRLHRRLSKRILQAPAYEERERLRRRRSCIAHMMAFPGLSLSAARKASSQARYPAP